MPADPNPLNDKDHPPIPGLSLLLFLAALAAFGAVALNLFPHDTTLEVLGLFFGASLAAVVIAVLPLGRGAWRALGLRAVGWRPIIFGTAGTMVLSVAVSQFGLEPQGMKQAVETAREPDHFLVSLVVLAGLAPLVEELVFRGLLYGWLVGRWGPRVAFALSALAFAAAHVERAHIILVLPLGVWFSWLRWRCNSVVPSLIAHTVNNGLAVAAAAFLGT